MFSVFPLCLSNRGGERKKKVSERKKQKKKLTHAIRSRGEENSYGNLERGGNLTVVCEVRDRNSGRTAVVFRDSKSRRLDSFFLARSLSLSLCNLKRDSGG